MKYLIILLLFAFPLLVLLSTYWLHLYKGGRAFYFNRIKWQTKINRKTYLEIDEVLNKRNSFYRHLSDNGKAKFIHRLSDLLRIKKFIGKEGLVLTHEIKIVVCSAMVQLTYGLKTYRLDNIKGFVIFPSIFYNSMIKRHLKGGTPPEGMMSFSWKDLEHGFLIEDDKYNLGLHEMAHALHLSMKYAYDFDVKFANYFNRWKAFGNFEFWSMKRGNDSFLRKYGAVNEHEFFAVCVEHFFEVPEQFLYNLPKIYYHLCVLLNLDPLNYQMDYQITK